MPQDQPAKALTDLDAALSPDGAWALLLTLAERRREGMDATHPLGFTLGPDRALVTTPTDDGTAHVIWSDQGLACAPGQQHPARDLIELYAPLFPASSTASLVVAHLGQSIDAQIATQSGDSCFVTGPENILHLHRMRALCDAIIVGAGTATADDPRLTTRLVEGRNPVRVVIDPERRLSRDARLFNDGEAPSLLVCAADRLLATDDEEAVIGLARDGTGLALKDLVTALRERGLSVMFIEGGGITVSRWMTAELLDRLQITIAPVLTGEGRPALRLPPARTMSACLRPPSRVFRMGDDLLWDFDLRSDDRQPTRCDDSPSEPLQIR